MSFEVKITRPFADDFVRLLAKYPSLEVDIQQLRDSLKDNPKIGASLGGGLYKVRLAIRSKNKGKSGGGRVITFVVIHELSVFLLAIYDKSEKEDLTPHELAALRALAEELKR